MDPDHVAAQVRERSGLDVQAVTLVRSGATDELVPSVWAAMTELGHFWAVEDGEVLELFRAVARRTSPDDLLACHSAVEAARRFLLLHPRVAEAPAAVRHEPGPGANGGAPDAASEAGYACQACGATFIRRRQTSQTGSTRVLCPRCRHAERERLRYQQDPRYRARRLAYSAARYRQSQQGSGEQP
jgi:DNA-directed RNA polymerase subunit RPC12/RpoP